MKRSSKRSGNVAIDTVPLPEEVEGLTTKKGKVMKLGSKYFLTVQGRKIEIPIGPVISTKDVKKLGGKDVLVVFSARKPSEIVAIGTWPTPEVPARFRHRWILCYIPAPDIIRRVSNDIREALIRKMVTENIITEKLAGAIRAAAPR